ncbi:MAG: response regulator [Candidatus Hydrogenedens sp.]|nr:response regulator [Candidatus Hydrogenedentota bacterium]NLF57458.1 response regulator [Candidatus Hydrogenedens sp.]
MATGDTESKGGVPVSQEAVDPLLSRRFRLQLAGALALAVVSHLFGRFGVRQGWYPFYVSDGFTLFSIFLIYGSAVLAMHRVYGVSLIFYTSLVAVLLIGAAQMVNIVDGLALLSYTAQQGTVHMHPLVTLLKEAAFVLGLTLLMGSFLLTIIESHRARIALARAYGEVERKVRERTRNLSDTNERLGHEITERLRTESALREGEEKFRTLVEASQDAIIRLDRKGRLLYANPCCREMFGIAPDAPMPLDYRTLDITGEEVDAWRDNVGAVMRLGETRRFEAVHPGTGAGLVLDWQVIPETDGGGTVVTVLAMGRDLTALRARELERQAMRERSMHAQRMETVGRLAGGVAHDFNNLLQIICGYLEMALASLPGDHPARARLLSMESATARATALVRQLLTFSRRDVVRREFMDLNRLTGDLVRMLRSVLGEAHMLRLEPCPEPPWIIADAGHIEQALLNLCVNARDAMPHGGEIRIVVGVAVMPESGLLGLPEDPPPGPYATLSVHDTGVGIPGEHLDKLFEPFFTTKEVGKGTGLGLATVYGVVRQHGGFVTVNSLPGAGATFVMHFPLVGKPGRSPHREEIMLAPRLGSGETILFAEDDNEVRTLGAQVLRAAGYIVLEARDGGEALRLIEAEPGIALHLLDIAMPEMSGREVYKRLVRRRPGARALFFSGGAEDTAADSVAPGDGPEVLQKPVAHNRLLQKIRQALDTV